MKLNFPVILAVFAFVGSASSSVFASPRPLPFSYPYATLGKGESEVETYADLTPVRVVEIDNPAQHDWYASTQFQIELEYGITDHLELGLYVTWVPEAGSVGNVGAMTENNGTKQRLRYRIAEPGVLPVDISLYGEVVESDKEFELEGKINLEKDFGKLAIMANLWAEREYEYAGESAWVLNPTLGATYQVTPGFHPGVEGWMRGEWADRTQLINGVAQPKPFTFGPHVYVGPTLSYNFGRVWLSVGGYLRVTDFNRVMQVGDGYGNVWLRTVVGVNF